MSDRNYSWLKSLEIAHRGLFTAGSTREENTIAAAKAAIEAGYAIEIDVQITADNLIVVFHDSTLERLTNGSGHIGRLGLKFIQQYEVGNTGMPIPTLAEFLEIVDGQAPLFIEIKTNAGQDIQKICAGVRHCFEGYRGKVAVMSFDPRVVEWFRRYMPNYIRGWVIGSDALTGFKAKLLSRIALWRIKPDFIACDINHLPNPLTAGWRKKGGVVLTWTVRSKEQERIGRQHADSLIFEAPAVVSTI